MLITVNLAKVGIIVESVVLISINYIARLLKKSDGRAICIRSLSLTYSARARRIKIIFPAIIIRIIPHGRWLINPRWEQKVSDPMRTTVIFGASHLSLRYFHVK